MPKTVYEMHFTHLGQPCLIKLALDAEYRTERDILNAMRRGHLYEPASSGLLPMHLRPGDTFIDVGSHVGFYALLAWSCVGPTGRVFAFEPNPGTYLGLLRNILLNGAGTIHAVNAAVADKSGVVRFHVNADSDGESALWDVAKVPGFVRTRAEPRSHDVAAVSLDDVLIGTGLNALRMMKIDAEGAERLVLDGAGRLLARMPPDFIICEINRGALQQCGASEEDIRSRLGASGYTAEIIAEPCLELPAGQRLVPYPLGERLETKYVFNLLFTRRTAPH